MNFNFNGMSIPATDGVELGEQQQEALEAMIAFLKDKSKRAFSLIGAAGTGKSFLMKTLIRYMESEGETDYTLCAPTHKAKLVLSRFADREAYTLHQLLQLSPNIEILELDFKDLKFIVNDKKIRMPVGGVVVCDESSMVNDDLFDLLIEKCTNFNCKVIFVGDKCQLRPVNSLTTSKVFNLQDRYTLTKIYRQAENNALMPILTTLRSETIDMFHSVRSEDGSLYCYSDVKPFLKSAVPAFKAAMRSGDILATKILAYTNAMVASYNNCIRRVIWEDAKEMPYHQFEFLTAYENLEFNSIKFWNSMDYIIVDEPKKRDSYLPGFMSLPGYELTLYDSSTNDRTDIFILDKDIDSDYTQALASRIEGIRLQAINLKENGRHQQAKLAWKAYYDLVGSFTSPIDLYYDNRLIRKKSFDYGYACSTHKSQGSSYGTVFVDMRNINICKDEDERRQLQYVALSRTRTDAHLFQ